jgi:hypothetical protein
MYVWWLRAATWKNQVILQNILIIVKINYSNSGINRFDDRNYHSWATPDKSVNNGTGQTLMPECRCRTEAADYWKKCRCRTNFSPAFRHSHMTFQYHSARVTPSTAAYGRAGCITFHYLQFGCVVYCSASSQSGTGMNKNSDAGTSPVLELGDPVRYRIATKLDWNTGCWNADAQLWSALYLSLS